MKKYILSFIMILLLFILSFFVRYYSANEDFIQRHFSNTTFVSLLLAVCTSLIIVFVLKKYVHFSLNSYGLFFLILITYYIVHRLFYVDFHIWYYEMFHGKFQFFFDDSA